MFDEIAAYLILAPVGASVLLLLALVRIAGGRGRTAPAGARSPRRLADS